MRTAVWWAGSRETAAGDPSPCTVPSQQCPGHGPLSASGQCVPDGQGRLSVSTETSLQLRAFGSSADRSQNRISPLRGHPTPSSPRPRTRACPRDALEPAPGVLSLVRPRLSDNQGLLRGLSTPDGAGTALPEVGGDRDAATSPSWFGSREAEDSAGTVSGGGDTCGDLKGWECGATMGCVTTVDTRTPPLWEVVGAAGWRGCPGGLSGTGTRTGVDGTQGELREEEGPEAGEAPVLVGRRGVPIAWAGGADTEVPRRSPGTPRSPRTAQAPPRRASLSQVPESRSGATVSNPPCLS